MAKVCELVGSKLGHDKSCNFNVASIAFGYLRSHLVIRASRPCWFLLEMLFDYFALTSCRFVCCFFILDRILVVVAPGLDSRLKANGLFSKRGL